ncbi:MAG: 4a-hydroxytetrahydrobiopterin dehydratase [Planctomycetota bacterium]
MKLLAPSELDAALRTLPHWSLRTDKLFRELVFADFAAAFSEMTRIALLAEARQHHPEWWNSYRTLRVWLTTHDAGGITEKDIELAHAIGA